MSTPERDALLVRQWRAYPPRHADRRNLALHAATNPLFLASNITLVAGPFFIGWPALAGLFGMALAMALQGRGHALEATPPEPFEGPVDVVRRIFAEQWLTFPRYVLSGGFSRAWRAARP